jgi:predicted RND superfamily exporter protein
MRISLATLYGRVVLDKPYATLFVIAMIVAFFSLHATGFKLDASAESLVLENDRDLRYYRAIRARYGSDDFLVITYTPQDDLLSPAVLEDLRVMRDELAQLERVESVVTLHDVPMLESPKVSLAELRREVRTFSSPGTERELARKELSESPLYRNLLMSPDGRTTALQINFKVDETFTRLLSQRNRLREQDLAGGLRDGEAGELSEVSEEFKRYNAELVNLQRADIAKVREIMDRHRGMAELHLGGVPMIVSDMIGFIRHDLIVFGTAVLCFLIALMAFVFRRPRWVVLPVLCCFGTVLIMAGFLGMVEWPVTVVSSNFVSLILILTLSLTVHLVVRYRELSMEHTGYSQRTLVLETVKRKVLPSAYTAATTMVAFASLLVSDIRPVIDFGWMMVIGIGVAFVLTFSLFPAALMLLRPLAPIHLFDVTGRITRFFAFLVEQHGRKMFFVYVALAIASVVGISKLTVENRFIDYFKKSTEIYQGMVTIDQRLGGTTPLDVVLDADPEFFVEMQEPMMFEDEDGDTGESAGLSGTSYWFNVFELETVDAVHNYLDSLDETGKVLSLATAMEIATRLNDNKPLDNFTLSVMYNSLPESVEQTLFAPYMSADGNQVRLAVRVFESDFDLRRDELLKKIRAHLTQELGLADERIHLSGMIVLYNNVLQSLFRSQILTLGVVFIAIMLMFVLLFRSLRVAALAIVPIVISAGLVLGLMGWLSLPLDIMTITIAAIAVGIGVHDTIHYLYRYTVEFEKDRDYLATIDRCHNSIGRAIYYTSVIIILGFSILVLSSFKPTIYFGLLTGFAMLTALIANLTLLPLLLRFFRPFGS